MQQWRNEILNAGIMIPILFLIMVASLVAPAPKRSFRKIALLIMAFAVFGMCSVVYLIFSGGDQWLALWLAAGAMCLSAVATWLSRGIGPDDDWGDGGTGKDWPDDDLPDPGGMDLPDLDWDDFDQERRSWDHQPTRV